MRGKKTDKMIVAIDKPTISVGDLNTPVSVTDRIRKISKKDLNSVNQIGLSWHVQCTPSPTAECTFFSSGCGKVSNIDIMTIP